MKKHSNEKKYVLAIYPNSKGFGFAVLEDVEHLINWGTKYALADKNARCVSQVSDLIDRYDPGVLVLERAAAKGSRRCARIRELIADLRKLASRKNVITRSFSRQSVREALSESGAFTKDEIAAEIAGRFPELAHRLPPRRKLWMPEDNRMNIFDAVAWGLTFFHRKESSGAVANAKVKEGIPSGYVVAHLGEFSAAHAHCRP